MEFRARTPPAYRMHRFRQKSRIGGTAYELALFAGRTQIPEIDFSPDATDLLADRDIARPIITEDASLV
jgi:hypothetical protein